MIIPAFAVGRAQTLLYHLERLKASGRLTNVRPIRAARSSSPDSKLLRTRGAAMVAGAETIKIHGEYIPVRAEVKNLPMLSAHADADEIMRWLRNFHQPPRMTFITHRRADRLRRSAASYPATSSAGGPPSPGHLAEDGPAMSSDPLTLLVAPSDVHRSPLRARRLGVHTHDQAVVFMRTDCYVCRSEGLAPFTRPPERGRAGDHRHPYQVSDGLVGVDEAGFVRGGVDPPRPERRRPLSVRHPDPVLSLSSVRSRIYGHRLDGAACAAIMADVVKGQYSDVHLGPILLHHGRGSRCRSTGKDTSPRLAPWWTSATA